MVGLVFLESGDVCVLRVCVSIQMHIAVFEKVGGNPPTTSCCSRTLTWPHAFTHIC